MAYKHQNNKKLALDSGIQTIQVLTNDDEVCIPRPSSILLAVLERRELCLPYFAGWFPEKNTKLKKSQLFRRTVRKMHTCQKPVEVQKSMPGNKVLHATRRTAKRC